MHDHNPLTMLHPYNATPSTRHVHRIPEAAVTLTLILTPTLTRHVYRIPEAAVGLAVGGVCAAIARLTDNAEMLHDQAFDDRFFMVWLLPPIIFAAGFNMNDPTL